MPRARAGSARVAGRVRHNVNQHSSIVAIIGVSLVVLAVDIVVMTGPTVIGVGSPIVVGASGVIATDLGFGLSNSTYGTGLPTNWEVLPEIP